MGSTIQILPTAITRLDVADLRKKDYELALQSSKQALAIRQKLYGKIHSEVSFACYQIGVIKHCLKEYDSAVHWHQQALDIRVELYGKKHPASARCYYEIAQSQYEMQDYDSALESCQQEHRGKTSAHASTLPVIVLRT